MHLKANTAAVILSCSCAAAMLLTGCQGIGGSTPAPTPTPTPQPAASLNSINHIILFMQENRSFDSYFGQINLYRAAQTPPLPQEVDTWGPNKTPDGVSTAGFDPRQIHRHSQSQGDQRCHSARYAVEIVCFWKR